MGRDGPDRRPAASAPEARDPESTDQVPRAVRATTTGKELRQFPARRVPAISPASNNAYVRRSSDADGVLSLAVALRQSCRRVKDQTSHARPLLSGLRLGP